jgi:hypothetical protein
LGTVSKIGFEQLYLGKRNGFEQLRSTFKGNPIVRPVKLHKNMKSGTRFPFSLEGPKKNLWRQKISYNVSSPHYYSGEQYSGTEVDPVNKTTSN